MYRFALIHIVSAILIVASGAAGCTASMGGGNPDERRSGKADDGNDDASDDSFTRDAERASRSDTGAREDDSDAETPGTQDAGASTRCGTCEEWADCVDGQCIANPFSQWDIRVNTLEVVNVNSGGTPYDGGDNLPDPYITVTIGGLHDSTRVAPNTLSADFNGEVVAIGAYAQRFGGDFCVHVLDDDSNNADDNMGEQCVVFTDFAARGSTTITHSESWGFREVTLSIWPAGTY